MLNLVTVVGRNTHILPHMLKHYEGMVDKIYVGVVGLFREMSKSLSDELGYNENEIFEQLKNIFIHYLDSHYQITKMA